MKVAFITQDDPIYILPLFDEFFRQDIAGIDVVGVFSCKTMGDRGRLRLIRELHCLYGAVGLLRLIGRSSFFKIMQGLPARASAKRFYSVAQISRAFNVPHRFIGNPNRQEFRSLIAAGHPDLLVSIACPYILKRSILSLPSLGCINIHHAPLPRYKGMMPTFWQMYHGEKQVAITVHTMSARLDEGNALLQEQLPIIDGESLDSLIRRTKRHGAHCLLKVLRQFAEQTQTCWSLENEPGSYFTFPTPAEMKEFRRRGFRAI